MKPVHAAALAAGALVTVLVFGAMVLSQEQPGNATQENATQDACPASYFPVCGTDGRAYPNDCFAKALNISVAYGGECKTATMCSDSDSGRDATEKGAVTNGTTVKEDACAGAGHVNEFYCSNGTITDETLPCPEGYDCADGRCAPAVQAAPVCNDPANGTDMYVAGTVTYAGAAYNDSCNMVDQVKEYYCQNGSLANTILVCPTGYQCSGGRCMEMDSVCGENDGGENVSKKGTLTITKGYDLVQKEVDSCYDANIVREYYCSGNSVANELIDCGTDSQCSDGACVPLSCTDSDGGQNLMVAGTVAKGKDSYQDGCDSTYNVREYYCDGGAIQSAVSTCPSGYVCKAGACTQEPSCSDSDSGRDYFHAGIVTKGTEAYPDQCASGLLMEYYCSGNTVLSEVVGCGPGAACQGGYCKVT